MRLAFDSVTGQREKAERLRALHRGPPILVLPNAWDAASARVFAAHPRCRAIGTASAAIAPSLGYEDHERTPRELMLEAVGRIARAVELPVTADLEAGYGDSAGTAEGAIGAGAVGLNLEDSTHEPDEPLAPIGEQADKIAAVREVGARLGVPLVINARVDVYLTEVGEPGERLTLTATRARAYREAGADCIFVVGVRDAGTIGALVREIDAPLNVLGGSGAPPVPELERLGVARVSVGPGPFRATLRLLEQVGRDLFEQGAYP